MFSCQHYFYPSFSFYLVFCHFLSLHSSHSAFSFVPSFLITLVVFALLRQKKGERKLSSYRIIDDSFTPAQTWLSQSQSLGLVLRWKPVFLMCPDDGNNDESPFFPPSNLDIFFEHIDFLWKRKERHWGVSSAAGVEDSGKSSSLWLI